MGRAIRNILPLFLVFGVIQLVSARPFSIQEADSLNKLSEQIFLRSPDSARSLAERALLISKRLEDTESIGYSFYCIGLSYWAQSHYPLSQFYYHSALDYLKKSNSPKLSICYTNLGRNYIDVGKYKEAKNCFDQSAKYVRTAKDRLDLASQYSWLLIKQKRYHEALKKVRVDLEIAKKERDSLSISRLYSRMGDVYKGLNQVNNGFAYYDSAMVWARQTNNNRLKANVLLFGYAALYKMQKRYALALEHTASAEQLASEIGVYEVVLNSYLTRMEIYLEQENAVQAGHYMNKYSRLQDSMVNVDKQRNAVLIQDYFNLSQKLEDADNVRKQNLTKTEQLKRQRNFIIVLLCGLLALILFLMLVYRLYRKTKVLSEKQKHQSFIIEQQKLHLDELNMQKDKMLAVIGHDLRSVVGNLKATAAMFDDGELEPAEVKELMAAINPMVRSADMTLSNLLSWAVSNIKGFTVRPREIILKNIAEEMLSLFDLQFRQKNMDCRVAIHESLKIVADPEHMRIILRNLFSNAVKFTPDNGAISSRAILNNTGTVTLSIENTGPGLSSKHVDMLLRSQGHFSSTGTRGEKGIGLGLLLCKELIEHNRGRISIESELGKSTTVLIELPTTK